MASPKRRFIHAAYQKIIGMGPAVVPLLLEELGQRPDDWFWALAAITGEDPAAGEIDFDRARDAWIDWGREHHYI